MGCAATIEIAQPAERCSAPALLLGRYEESARADELTMFAEANPARLPLALLNSEYQSWEWPLTSATDSLMRWFPSESVFFTPRTIALRLQNGDCIRNTLIVVVAHRDGHVLAVTTAMLLVSRWCIRSRQNQVLSSFLIALQCAPNFCAVVLTKENVATKENVPAKALVVDLDPPNRATSTHCHWWFHYSRAWHVYSALNDWLSKVWVAFRWKSAVSRIS